MSPPRIGFIGLGRMGRPMAFTGDLGNVIEATSIGGRRLDFFTAKPGNLGLLQQYRHKGEVLTRAANVG
jgi:hypothetical protein